jgi:signal transduction histidine kinase
MNFRAMHWRLMAAFALFTLVVTLIFGLFAMAFVYTVEDMFIERQLEQEATRQQQHHATTGTWAMPQQSFIRVHTSAATLPVDMAAEWGQSPGRKEFYGTEGRHYHAQRLGQARMPLLVAEVSSILIVRPIRNELLGWLAGWGAVMMVIALILGAWLARRVSAPLEALARAAGQADPANLPQSLPGARRGDEVGVMARAMQALMARTRNFIEREQAFTRDASHELRTPLAVMGMALERARAEAPGTHAQLDAAAAATTHMTQTVNTLLMLAREDTVEAKQDCALLPLIEQWVLANEAQLAAQHCTPRIEVPGDARMALPGPAMQMVLSNLLGNALTHGTPGGTITVRHEAGTLVISNPSAPIPQDAGARGVKGEASAGFGLGLSIVQRLLTRHGAVLDITYGDGMTTASVRTE